MSRKLVYFVAVSLDGFIAAPDGDFTAFPTEGDHMQAIITEYADAIPAHIHRALGTSAPGTKFDTVLMGWNTYNPETYGGIDSPYTHLRQVVVSRSARSVPEHIELINDPVSKVRELKQEDGLDIYLCGGGQLAQALREEIDTLILKRYPLVFGSGIPLFGDADYTALPFTHLNTRTFNTGVSFTEYERAR
ncbi:dihydrofolate reductase family protein [Glutamicibacter arilaitensis]|uniref:dihydrofolate reductase family protein n=1 Tax=Glutamicibacter arilaitensis TaxID=256701 RepID=UPI00384BB945